MSQIDDIVNNVNDEEDYFSDDDSDHNLGNESNHNSDEEDYFSNDENDSEGDKKELTFDEMYPEEAIDDELRQILYANAINTEYNDVYDKLKEEKKKHKKRKEKKQKHMDLSDFLEKEEKRIEADKPKKWKSSRIINKKKKLKIVEKPKRCFRPRYPPPDKKIIL